jgi:hypothetical protein
VAGRGKVFARVQSGVSGYFEKPSKMTGFFVEVFLEGLRFA